MSLDITNKWVCTFKGIFVAVKNVKWLTFVTLPMAADLLGKTIALGSAQTA